MGALSNIKISKFKYDEKLPSTGKKVAITPFRVGDEKVLLEAAESKDPKHQRNAIKQVIENCVEGVKFEDLAPYDVDYLFMKLRAKSVGETADIGISCEECEEKNKLTVNIDTVEVYKDPSHTNKVKLQDDLMLEMKYPDTSNLNIENAQTADGMLEVIFYSVDKVYYGEETIDLTPSDKQDFISLIGELSKTQFEEIQKFFTTMPKLKKDVEFTCGSCGHENKYSLEGLASFLS